MLRRISVGNNVKMGSPVASACSSWGYVDGVFDILNRVWFYIALYVFAHRGGAAKKVV